MKIPIVAMPPLIRKFANGEKFIVQNINGKTYRQFYDKNGNKIVDQVKSIKRVKVGNKKIRNITKNYAYEDSGEQALFGNYHSLDKVYSKNGKYLGSREFIALYDDIYLPLSDQLKAQELKYKLNTYVKELKIPGQKFVYSSFYNEGVRTIHEVASC